jgi:hypothetical protein
MHVQPNTRPADCRLPMARQSAGGTSRWRRGRLRSGGRTVRSGNLGRWAGFSRHPGAVTGQLTEI